jgi:SAM-dependent methyltransferase
MFWTEHWAGRSVEEQISIARTSPLTEIIDRHLPAGGRLLEAGCGVGQYVLLLRERGRAALGVDWSLEAVSQGVRAGAPLAVMDLRLLGIRDGSISAYLSLGVVEHDPQGPDGIIAEASRVLTPSGVLLLSVPYWNGLRRLLARHLVSRNRRIRASGGEFYQFAFTRGEVSAFLKVHGFEVRAFHPYDPARVFRQASRALRGASSGGTGERTRSRTGGPDPTPGRLKRVVRRLLYTSPMLRLFGHMILAVAVKR